MNCSTRPRETEKGTTPFIAIHRGATAALLDSTRLRPPPLRLVLLLLLPSSSPPLHPLPQSRTPGDRDHCSSAPRSFIFFWRRDSLVSPPPTSQPARQHGSVCESQAR